MDDGSRVRVCYESGLAESREIYCGALGSCIRLVSDKHARSISSRFFVGPAIIFDSLEGRTRSLCSKFLRVGCHCGLGVTLLQGSGLLGLFAYRTHSANHLSVVLLLRATVSGCGEAYR